MEITAERYEDDGLRDLAEAGADVTWQGEIIRYHEDGVEYSFHLPGSDSTEAVFSSITAAGRTKRVKYGRPQGSDFCEYPGHAPMTIAALTHLRESRGVHWVAMYDGMTGGYRRFEIAELLSE